MPTYTCEDIIVGALKLLGKGRAENFDTTNDIDNNIPFLNNMIAALVVDQLLIQQTTDEGFVLAAGLREYTIGLNQTPGPGVFDTSVPWKIESAYIVDQNQNHYDMDIITRDQFDTIVDQELSQSRPTQLFYDIGSAEQGDNPIGTIWLYYIPDSDNTYTLHLVSTKQLVGFANSASAVNFDISYMDLLQSRLAKRLAPMYGKEISQELKDMIRESTEIVRMQNYRRPSFARRRGGGFSMNVYTSQVNN